MILSSLVDYYEILAETNNIAPLGYSIAKVAYAIRLSKEGEVRGALSLKISEQRGKKTVEVAQSILVPEQEILSSGIKANFLCDNSGYLLGVDSKGKPDRTKRCFDASFALHHMILDGVDSVCAKAVLAFFDHWKPEYVDECGALKDELEGLIAGGNLVFYVDGSGYVHEDSEVKNAWEVYKAKQSDAPVLPCLVTGKKLPVAILHPKIKGVKDAQGVGASLVSFNADAFESFGHKDAKGKNAPVSEYAAFAYTTVLNYLLSDEAHKTYMGDTTVVYWAKSPQKIYRDVFSYFFNPSETIEDKKQDKKNEALIHSVFEKIKNGEPVRNFSEEFDPETEFNILGLSPNSGRISVRFYLKNPYGKFIENIAAHYRDLELAHAPGEFNEIPLWKLLLETVSSASKNKASSPLLTGSVLRSVLLGTQYPQALQNSVILRIRAEHEVTRGKAAIMKAFLIRKHKNDKYKEELSVSLSEQSENKAYIFGRLFAVLEKAQQDANPGINTTIKDRYFTSACATPACVFPILLRLSVHHITKANYGWRSEQKISELMNKLDAEKNPFPARLSLDEQGLFILGYYHQQKANYAKNRIGGNENV